VLTPHGGVFLIMTLALCAASAANALVVITTYKGYVDRGYDNSGVFAPVGTDLAGYSFVAQFISSDIGGSYNAQDGLYSERVFTSDFSDVPPISGSITINRVTVSDIGNFISGISRSRFHAGEISNDAEDHFPGVRDTQEKSYSFR